MPVPWRGATVHRVDGHDRKRLFTPPPGRAWRCLGWLLALLCAACATRPGTSVPQTLTVETPGCPGARCELSNDRGTWVVPSTPGAVTVVTSTTALRLSCRGGDGQPVTIGTSATAARPTGKGAVVGGALGGAAVGAGVGSVALGFIPALGVIIVAAGVTAGAVTGQAFEARAQALQYPATLTLPMSCGAAPAPAAPFGFQVRELDATAARAAGLVPAPGAAERGVLLVTAVNAGSLAEAAGLRTGDLLLAAGDLDAYDATQVEQALRLLTPGQTLVLRLLREGQVIERTLQRATEP